jgi:amino acid transporter
MAIFILLTAFFALTSSRAVKGMNAFVVLKVGVLIFICVAGWAVLGGAVDDRIPDPRASFRNSFVGTSSSGYEWSIALFKVLDSYTGWSNAAYVVNEIKNPIRTLKIAGPLGLGICGVLYMLANVRDTKRLVSNVQH